MGQATYFLKEATLNKIIIGLMAIYFLGDPHLQSLSWLGDMKLYVVASAIALVSMPWIAEQLDGLPSLRDGPDTVPPHGDLRVAVFIAVACALPLNSCSMSRHVRTIHPTHAGTPNPGSIQP